MQYVEAEHHRAMCNIPDSCLLWNEQIGVWGLLAGFWGLTFTATRIRTKVEHFYPRFPVSCPPVAALTPLLPPRPRAPQTRTPQARTLQDTAAQMTSTQVAARAGSDMMANPTLAEVFAKTAADGAASAFVLAHLKPGGPVLWVQDRLTRQQAGRPYPPGFGAPVDLLYLELGRPVDVLWAMEQALGTAGLSAVVGEVWGDAPALTFTATKRLALRAEAHGVAAWLVRRAATPDLSAARERWTLSSLPSAADPNDLRAPGTPIWRADLFRARWRTPADWVASYDRAAHTVIFDHPVAARPDADSFIRRVG